MSAGDQVLDILHDQPRGKINLIGVNGNAGAILATAVQSAKKAGWDRRAIDLLRQEMFSCTYDEWLCLVMDLFDHHDPENDW